MRKFKKKAPTWLGILGLVAVLLLVACNKSDPPHPLRQVLLKIVDSQSKESLVSSTGLYYHQDSIQIFNHPDYTKAAFCFDYDDNANIYYKLITNSYTSTVYLFLDKYDGMYRDTFYLYLNQYDTDTLELIYSIEESGVESLTVLHNQTIMEAEDDYYLILKNKEDIR